jgi:serine/threonine protein kinase
MQDIETSISRSNRIRIIKQGSYGCIVTPSIRCDGNIGSKKYITKIQRKATTSKREVEISNIVRTIPHYKQYFAPVLKSCPISLGKIDPNEIKKCKFITDVNAKYESNTIAYAGDSTLAEYLLRIFAQHPKDFFRVFINTQRELMYALSLLESKQVIHFDMKENNVMVNHSSTKPSTTFRVLIIDFGLSYNYSQLSTEKPETYEELFYAYGADYQPWCIEIAMISYFVNEIPNWRTTTLTKEHLRTVTDEYLSKHPFCIDFKARYPTRFSEYSTKLITYAENLQNRPCIQIVGELSKSIAQWDMSALCVLFFYLVDALHMQSYSQEYPLFNTYMEFLYSVLLALPNERNSTSTTQSEFERLFKTTNQVDNTQHRNNVAQFSKDPNNLLAMRKKVAAWKLNDKLPMK